MPFMMASFVNPFTATFGKLAWLVPFYLWRRAKTLGQKPAYFWVWLVMLILTVMA